MVTAVHEVDDILRELEKLSPEDQRTQFFVRLGELPYPSIAREHLKILARPIYAPGPYSQQEFVILNPLVPAKERERTPDEIERADAHAAAYAAREEAATRWQDALMQLHRARGKNDREQVKKLEVEVSAAREALDEAGRIEIAARVYQPRGPKRQRSILRNILSRMG